MNLWHIVSNPIQAREHIPAERKVVLVWLRESRLPFCGYIRYAAGDKLCPYFVVYTGNSDIGADVVAWCDCLPDMGPEGKSQSFAARGRPERCPHVRPIESLS